MRAVIYARYSSDNQREASIEDQVRVCRERIEREGWTQISVYTDRAVSGATVLRAGYQQLLADCRAGAFDVIVTESLDRLSRDQEDIAALYKQASYASVQLLTLAEGEINELHVGVTGAMSALYLKNLAQKTHRGLEGRVRKGRSGGGLCFGYDVVEDRDERGGRSINKREAAIVQRIFRDYANGLSPRAIAKALNARGTQGPRGKTWNASTITGNWRRGTGLLNNELYIGRLVWNRQSFVKDPSTGRRQARPNPPEDWIIHEVPELRIIEDALWDAVKARQEVQREKMAHVSRNTLNGSHRAKYILSGLLTCGTCGGSYTICAQERYGCANHINRGTCDNPRTIAREDIEARVLDGLRERLMAPDMLEAFIEEYRVEMNRLAGATESDWQASRRELVTIDRKIEAMLSAIEDGIYTPATKGRLLALESRKAELTSMAAPEPTPRIHPRITDIYRDKVENLRAELDRPDTRQEAGEAIRALIDRIVLYPGDKRGQVNAELYGELCAILDMAENNKTRDPNNPGTRVSMVAGARLIEAPTIQSWV